MACDGTSSYCDVLEQEDVSIAVGEPIRIRAEVVGNQLSCSLPDRGVSTTHEVEHESGGVALVTFHADASFDYLRVWRP